MARIETWFDQDLKKAVKVHYLDGNVFSQDNNGNLVGVNVYSDGSPVTLSGDIIANVIRADGATLAVTGSISANRAFILLPQAAYAVPGVISIVIKQSNGGDITTLCAVVANVYMSSTDAAVDPGTIIPSITDLINAINTAVASIPADYSDLYWSLMGTGRDVLPLSGTPGNFTFGGITVTQIDKSTYHFQGTISSSSFVSWYANVNNMPNWLIKGKPYTVEIKGASASNENGIYFNVLGFQGGSSQVNFLPYTYSDGYYTFTIPTSFSGGVYIRAGWLGANAGHVVDETIEFHMYSHNAEGILHTANIMHYITPEEGGFTSCDDVPPGFITFVSSSGGVLNISDFPFNTPGTLVCLGEPDFPVQLAYNWNTTPKTLTRTKGLGGTWTAWASGNDDAIRILGWANVIGITNLNDCGNGIIFVSTSGGVSDIENYPFTAPGMVHTYEASDTIKWQIAYPWNNDTNKRVKMRVEQSGTWTNWLDISGSSETITVEQEVSRDTYNNTYNIDVSPQITTDANGWLQPVDTNTADETGKTDMTGAIMAMLTQTGYCHLAPGIYYVSGNIDMPADSMIEGCGKQTIIRLLQTTTSGYIVRMHTRSTLKNVCLSGGYNQLTLDANLGGRKGINYIGNRDGQSTGVTPTTCTLCQIEGCWFENLDSGFYGYNAGGGLQEGLEVSNCYFTRCKAGINFDYWTEYSKFTNCVTFQCYYGCINNGGNNVFMNCTFHAVIGFLIDNSSGNKANAAHGSVIGCTFNHIDNMGNPSELGKGIGIKVLNTTAGFIFANCQLWYGRIHIESSKGIQITGCEFGGLGGSSYPVIESSGSDMIFVDNCLFQSTPSFSISSPSKFTNCWTYAGDAVTG